MPDTTPDGATTTRDRLIDAATTVFAEHGFRDAGVREICRRAGANPAAVNYHFGSKQELYWAVLRHAFEKAGPAWPMPRLADEPTDPEGRLREWIRWFAERMFGETVMSQLMIAEMRDHTEALDRLIDESIRPVFEEVSGMVAAMTGLHPTSRRVELCVSSIIGQCLFYKAAKPLVERLHSHHRRDLPEIERVADHVYRFSIAGICAISEQPWDESPRLDRASGEKHEKRENDT